MAHGKSIELRYLPGPAPQVLYPMPRSRRPWRKRQIISGASSAPPPYRNPDRAIRKRARLEQRRAARARRAAQGD